MFPQFQTKESGVVCKLLKETLLSQIEPQINHAMYKKEKQLR